MYEATTRVTPRGDSRATTSTKLIRANSLDRRQARKHIAWQRDKTSTTSHSIYKATKKNKGADN